ncbi:50S ribosomal protein L33 [Patescibacteria group bacterium]|nr:50S ribosomal protein L33 [Patescibacteria group bacterium]
MSQDNMIKLECTLCKRVNYNSKKNKKTLKQRLILKKFCKFCSTHADHKETK